MRNYIILNEINSNTISGLLISTLPPISKPLIRTQVEEIDGRDGDIVTTLGYSAYDKQFDIGLYGNYDINEIIKYFNSKGIVVFSNEPDKYYNYEILEQIDFEKLIRFKTATVTMHIQPFKYLVDEQPIEENATEISDEGKNITLNNTNDGFLFNDLKVKGDIEQATRSGKNLFDEIYENISTNIIYRPIEVGSGTFTMSCNIPQNNNGASIFLLPGNVSSGVSTSSNGVYINHSITQTSINGYVTVAYRIMDYNPSDYDVMLEQGSTATSYEPYGAMPSPGFPSPVNNVTGDLEVKVQNKNLLPFTNQDFTLNDIRYYVQNGELYLNGTSRGETYRTNQAFKDNFSFYLEAGTYFIKQHNNNAVSKYISKYDDNTLIATINSSVTYKTFTLSERTKVVLGFYVYQLTADNINLELQLEKGSTPSTYTPHQEQNYSISLGDIELCKIGEYQDYIYKENGNWYKYGAIGKVDLSTFSWTRYANYKYLTRDLGSEVVVGSAGVATVSKAEKYKARASGEEIINGNFAIGGTSDSSILYVYDNTGEPSGMLYYPLATPAKIPITDTTLINQLNASENAYSYDDITHIISDGNLAPIVFAKINTIENEQTITNEGNYFSKPKITIYGKGTIGINIDGLQVLSIELNSDETDHITIDSSIMEAYTDNLNTLRNRAVTGDYNNLKFNPGDNNISFSGVIECYIIENYTRWL